MENSQAYKYVIEQIDVIGSKKLDGYYPRVMEEIYDWERDQVEDIVWNQFCEKEDIDMAVFLPKIRKYLMFQSWYTVNRVVRYMNY